MTAPCVICGYPKWRTDGHADWCEQTKAWLRDPRAPEAPRWVGMTIGSNKTKPIHRVRAA